MGLNNISNDFQIFKKFMIDLYDINFKFNGWFCKIHIHYNIIHNGSTMLIFH
jgi:hypothetical protein